MIAALVSALLIPIDAAIAVGSSKEIKRPVLHSKKHRIHSKPEFNPVATHDDPYGDEQVREASDPFEKMNRGTFAFNHQVYRFVTKPLAKFTNFILPKPARTALEHAVANLESPVRITSSLLQGKVRRAGQETGKLLVNSTLGIGGLWKPSDRIDSLKKVPSEDMGQTFGKWGIPAGPYLVVPVLGPSSVRDLPGKAADACLSPTMWLNENTLSTITSVSKAVIENPHRMEMYDDATSDALDPYISMREGFTSYRKRAVEK
jgi:phospholipid-binding lipoprotein MlaA